MSACRPSLKTFDSLVHSSFPPSLLDMPMFFFKRALSLHKSRNVEVVDARKLKRRRGKQYSDNGVQEPVITSQKSELCKLQSGNSKEKKISASVTQTIYYRAEFRSMGDVTRDGTLNKPEFLRLAALLGIPDPQEAEMFWNRHIKTHTDKLTENEYIDMMNDKEFDEKSSMWRKLFAEFDLDGNGCASQKDIFKGLDKMGISLNADIKEKISQMDTNKTGNIQYGDFLTVQILKK